jgi:spore germination protein GerM
MKKKTRRKLFVFISTLVIIGAAAAGIYFFLNQTKSPTVSVYFFKGSSLVAVKRTIGADEAPLNKALHALLQGPDLKEAGRGIISEIPSGTKILGIKAEKKLATINFNDKLELYGGGAAKIQGIIAQIVYTATSIKGINKVWIWVNGKKEVVLGGEGLVLDRPLSRRDIRY